MSEGNRGIEHHMKTWLPIPSLTEGIWHSGLSDLDDSALLNITKLWCLGCRTRCRVWIHQKISPWTTILHPSLDIIWPAGGVSATVSGVKGTWWLVLCSCSPSLAAGGRLCHGNPGYQTPFTPRISMKNWQSDVSLLFCQVTGHLWHWSSSCSRSCSCLSHSCAEFWVL